jgi:N-acetylmuramoyl-L-alanine amidase
MEDIKLGSKGEAVSKLQKILNVKQDGDFGPVTEQALKDYQTVLGMKPTGEVSNTFFMKSMLGGIHKCKRDIKEIIIHCSATKENKDFKKDDIKKWHLQRGFSDVGYHYIIYLDGSVHKGRNDNLVGAHCINHNLKSIGICYIGGVDENGKPKDTRTEKQKESLVSLIRTLKRFYPNAEVYGHCDFDNKACPCFNASAEYKNL